MVTSRVTTAGKNISEWGYIVPCNAQHEWFYLVSIDVYRWLFIISYGGIAKETANLSDLVGGTAGPKSLADGVFFGDLQSMYLFILVRVARIFHRKMVSFGRMVYFACDLFVFELSSLPVVRNLISRLK